MWRIQIDHNCAGTGSCAGIAPEYFRLGADDTRSQLLVAEVEPDEAVLDAMALCPMEAITVHDVETGEPVLP